MNEQLNIFEQEINADGDSCQVDCFVSKPVTLRISFEDLLGKQKDNIAAAVRKERWHEWQRLAKEAEANGDENAEGLVDYWKECPECDGCKWFDEKESWCNGQELPASVNPILTYGMGIIGMACMGAGYEKKE